MAPGVPISPDRPCPAQQAPDRHRQSGPTQIIHSLPLQANPASARIPYRSATCANARRLRLLSVTGFPSASVLGWQSLQMQTDHMAWPSPAAVSALLDPVRGRSGRPRPGTAMNKYTRSANARCAMTGLPGRQRGRGQRVTVRQPPEPGDRGHRLKAMMDIAIRAAARPGQRRWSPP
jgi:hypothetical protein